MDVKVKVIYDGEKGDIINQYCAFTQIVKEQIGKYGRTRKAVIETIRICEEKNVLKKFFESREKEVKDIMTTLFSQESAVDAMLYEREQESRREGRQEGQVESAYKFYKSGLSIENIAKILEIPVKELEKWMKEAEKQEREHLN